MKFAFLLLVVLGVGGAVLYSPFYGCEPCGGDGQVSATVQTVKCRACGGKGTRKSMSGKKGVKSIGTHSPMCLTCKGAGVLKQRVSEGGACLICDGSGKRSMYDKMTRKAE